eukprot:237210-Alexandrium_andersonii.AAC.1
MFLGSADTKDCFYERRLPPGRGAISCWRATSKSSSGAAASQRRRTAPTLLQGSPSALASLCCPWAGAGRSGWPRRCAR